MFEEKLKTLGETYEQKHAELVAVQREEFKKIVNSFLDDCISSVDGNFDPYYKHHEIPIKLKLHFSAPVQPETEDLISELGLVLKVDDQCLCVEGRLSF